MTDSEFTQTHKLLYLVILQTSLLTGFVFPTFLPYHTIDKVLFGFGFGIATFLILLFWILRYNPWGTRTIMEAAYE